MSTSIVEVTRNLNILQFLIVRIRCKAITILFDRITELILLNITLFYHTIIQVI